MALPSFVQHLGVLEDCGLVRSRKQGRVRTCELVGKPLSSAEKWLNDTLGFWEARVDALAEFVAAEQRKKKR